MMRGSDVFDPRTPVPIPVIVSEGNAFPMQGSTVKNFNNSTTTRMLFAYANTGDSGTVLAWVQNTATPSKGVETIPLLAAADDAGGPTSGRAMKGGLTIVNRTQYLNQGGQVAVLAATQRVSLSALPSLMTQAQWNTFFDEIVAHPSTRLYNGSDFRTAKTFITHPTDQSDYTKYQPWMGTSALDDWWKHVAIWPGGTPENRPMSTVFVVFEASDSVNSYEAKTRSHFYTRWPLNSVPGQAQKPVPIADTKVVNAQRIHAEATSHLAREGEIGLGAALAGLGGLAYRAAQSAGGAAGAVARNAGMLALENPELALPLLALGAPLGV